MLSLFFLRLCGGYPELDKAMSALSPFFPCIREFSGRNSRSRQDHQYPCVGVLQRLHSVTPFKVSVPRVYGGFPSSIKTWVRLPLFPITRELSLLILPKTDWKHFLRLCGEPGPVPQICRILRFWGMGLFALYS